MLRTTLRVPVTDAPAGVRTIAVTVVAPDEPDAPAAAPPTALVCLPGGGMSGRYFDLAGEDGDGPLSMAAHLARRGFVVLLVAPPAIGGSDMPRDAWTLTPSRVAAVAADAADRVLRVLSGPRPPADSASWARGLAGVPSRPGLRALGVGHSMGAMLTAIQQASARPYAGLVALGFSGRGMPEVLSPAEARYAGDRDALEADLRTLAEARFGAPLTGVSTTVSPMLVPHPLSDPARTALVAANAPLIKLGGMMSLVPGSIARELGAVDVPVFAGVGESDITGPAAEVPDYFPASPQVTLSVLAGAGHNHNVAPTRLRLWDAVAEWAAGLPPPAA
jgi:alpha-beta hydrolase superfamily lysophospholipase